MKKFLAVFLVLAMLVGAVGFSALASNYDETADELFELGLFKGQDSGYALDSASTRAEALTMFIRILGMEAAALESDEETPFTDVPEWARPYVGYAYANGLTNGISATEFGSSMPCDANTYVTFVLRALGYSDKAAEPAEGAEPVEADFSFAEAVSFGVEVGIVTEALAEGSFLRDNMVAISYLSLGAAPKDSEFDSLLAKLVDDGAVDAEAAAPLLEKIAEGLTLPEVEAGPDEALVQELDEALAAMAEITSIDMDMTAAMDMTMGETAVSTELSGNAKVSLKDDALLMAMTLETAALGETVAMEIYYKDGYIYTASDIEGVGKIKMPLELDDALLGMQTPDTTLTSADVLAGIEKTEENGNVVYALTVDTEQINSVIGDMLSSEALALTGLGVNGVDAAYKSLTVKLTFDAQGALKTVAIAMEYDASLTIEEEVTTVAYKADVEIEIIALGDDVVIEFPDDLDSYEEAAVPADPAA